MDYHYKGYIIKAFKSYYLIYDNNDEEVAAADNIDDAKYTIDSILSGS